MAIYIHDNTDDEITHHQFLNAYLASKGAAPANLDPFRTLMGSTATGVNPDLIGRRLTNLTQLTIDTSWWTRYRDDSHNPDLDPDHVFPQVVPTLGVNQHTAIPRTDADTTDANFLQAIANTAAFHFPTIEQGGNSLYPSLALRATHEEVLRILISIGPTETMHFQTWSDKAGNAPMLTAVDPMTGVTVTFPDLSGGGELFQNNLIMPEPCPFLDRSLPIVSIIRPTKTEVVATGALQFLTDMSPSSVNRQRFCIWPDWHEMRTTPEQADVDEMPLAQRFNCKVRVAVESSASRTGAKVPSFAFATAVANFPPATAHSLMFGVTIFSSLNHFSGSVRWHKLRNIDCRRVFILRGDHAITKPTHIMC
jgi:hypothetical protein